MPLVGCGRSNWFEVEWRIISNTSKNFLMCSIALESTWRSYWGSGIGDPGELLKQTSDKNDQDAVTLITEQKNPLRVSWTPSWSCAAMPIQVRVFLHTAILGGNATLAVMFKFSCNCYMLYGILPLLEDKTWKQLCIFSVLKNFCDHDQ